MHFQICFIYLFVVAKNEYAKRLQNEIDLIAFLLIAKHVSIAGFKIGISQITL